MINEHNNHFFYGLNPEEAWKIRLRFLKQEAKQWEERFETLTNFQIRIPDMSWYFEEEIAQLAHRISGRKKFIASKPTERPQRAELSQLKEIPIKDVLAHLGVKEERPRWYLCPFHNDKNASMYIYPEKNIAKCFSCGQYASNLDVVMSVERISFAQAVEYLTKYL